MMKLALALYVARTPQGRHLDLTYKGDTSPVVPADPWNSWVFRTSPNAYFNLGQSTGFLNSYGSISASRTSPELKLSLSLYGNYAEDRFDVEDETVVSVSRSRGGSGSAVFSLSEHWSAIAFGGGYPSTHENKRLALGAGSGIEYNIFPYSESTRRELRISYGLETGRHTYIEETIYGQTARWFVRGSLEASQELKQIRGTVELTMDASHYYHDFSKRRLMVMADIDVRLVEGFSLSVQGSYAAIHDQLFLPKRGATRDEILLRQRQLETHYQYWGSLGLSYTFGSIYSNVVNPRFGN